VWGRQQVWFRLQLAAGRPAAEAFSRVRRNEGVGRHDVDTDGRRRPVACSVIGRKVMERPCYRCRVAGQPAARRAERPARRSASTVVLMDLVDARVEGHGAQAIKARQPDRR